MPPQAPTDPQPGQPMGEPVPDFTLPLLAGGEGSLSRRLASHRGGVVVFWSGVCSHCVRYDGYLSSFPERHPELALLVVASRENETREQLRATLEERGLPFPLYLDTDRSTAHAWLVRQTPRAFLVDGERRLLYRGAIDNYRYPEDPGHEPYLEAAVAAFLAGDPVPRAETPGFGCPIESVYYQLPKP